MRKALALLIISAAGLQLAAAEVSFADTTVTGTGYASLCLLPDAATVSIYIEVGEPKVEDLASKADKVAEDIYKSIAKKGEVTPFIQESPVSVYSELNWESNQLIHTLTSYITFTVEDLDILDDVLGKMIEPYVNDPNVNVTVSSIGYTVKDYDKYVPDLRKKALAMAEQDAREVATAHGADIGKLLMVSESPPTPDMMFYPREGWLFDAEDAAPSSNRPRVLIGFDAYVVYELIVD